MAQRIDQLEAVKEKTENGESCWSKVARSRARLIVLATALVIILVVVVVCITLDMGAPDDKPEPSPSKHQEGVYTRGAVASDSGICSEVGRDILRKDGSAVDAAIATQFCLGVTLLHNTGIGGGGFALVYKKEDELVEAFDFRETAPANASKDMYLDPKTSSQKGGMATGVPGFVKGLHVLWKQHGTLPWSELLQPAIKLAQDGFLFDYALHEIATRREEKLYNDSGLRELFFNKDGELKRKGDKIKDLALAQTLRDIAKDPDTLYTGSMAQIVEEDIAEAGGIITRQDLQDYFVRKTQPLKVKVGDRHLYAMRPPSSGAVVAMILNILDGYDLTSSDLDDESKAPLTYHRIVEAFKFAYAYRGLLGDAAFEDTSEVETEMLNTEKAKNIRKLIQDDKTYKNESYYGGYYSIKEDFGTSHTSIIDSRGNAVALTSTINYYFGAMYRSQKTGIVYNNEMDDFSTPGEVNHFGYQPTPSNFIVPGKRPMSSMSPVIVLDDQNRVRIVSGASGGSKIITGTAQTLIDMLWFNRNALDAVTLPRLHHQLLPNHVLYTTKTPYNMPQHILDGLRERGHQVKSRAIALCMTQAISTDDDGRIYAKSDPRKQAWAAGY